MSLESTLSTGVSGLQSNGTRLSVIGNNIANSNTAGFKASRVTFNEYLVQTIAEARRPLEGGNGGVNPIEFGLGASARFLHRRLVLAADLSKNVEQDFVPRVGAEYLAYADLALRSGYSDGRFAAGTGYRFKLGNRLLAIDYAFSTDKVDEGAEHIFSFDLLF